MEKLKYYKLLMMGNKFKKNIMFKIRLIKRLKN